MSPVPQLEQRLRPYLAERAAEQPAAGLEDRVLREVRHRSHRPANPSWFTQVMAAAAVIVLAAGLAIGIVYLRTQGKLATTPHVSPNPTISATINPSIAPTAVPFRQFSGTGSTTTAGYSTSGRWDLTWSYDCSNVGSPGRFQLEVYDELLKAQDPNQVPIDETRMAGNGTQEFNTSSLDHLVITTQCAWHVTLAYAPRPQIP